MSVDLEFSGFEELMGKLAEKGRNIDRIGNKALKESAKVLRDEIKRRAPRSQKPRENPKDGKHTWRTGEHAADHISISRVKTDKYGTKNVFVGVEKGDNSPYFYMKFMEWGTSEIAAQPFVLPAKEAKKAEVIKKQEEVLRKELARD